MRELTKVGLAIAGSILIYSIIFMALMSYEGQIRNVEPIAAIYWVVATITTVGYGDIVFHKQAGRIFSLFVALSGMFMLWAVILPLVIAPGIERLTKWVPTEAPSKMADHIIICKYNPTVETLIEKLSIQKIPFLIIERSEEVARRIFRRYPTILGEASDSDVLVSSNLHSARLFIANEEVERNAEIIMAVRETSKINLIAIVDDIKQSHFLKYAGASRVISPKTLLGHFIAHIAVPTKRAVLPGAIPLFEDLKLMQLPIYPWSELIRKTIDDQSIKDTQASIAGIWQRGVFKPNPSPREEIQQNSVLLAVGDKRQLCRIRELTIGSRRHGSIVIIGYGDSGRLVADAICKSGIKPIVVDRRSLGDIPFAQVTGDGASEETLLKAGVREAMGVLVMLNKDPDVIYSTLMIRQLNPSTFIVARANHVKSAEKIYRAGADYVASVPIIASHMLAKIVHGDDEELSLLYEDLELKILEVEKRSGLAGKALGKLNLTERFGCGIVAIKREGKAIFSIDMDMLLKPGDMLALIGSIEELEALGRKYDRHPIWSKL